MLALFLFKFSIQTLAFIEINRYLQHIVSYFYIVALCDIKKWFKFQYSVLYGESKNEKKILTSMGKDLNPGFCNNVCT